jgi:predicted component of type VI protein secretion system
MLPLILAMPALLSGFGLPAGRMPVSSHQMKSALHQAVFRFDTRIVFSCEEFAREMAGRALVNMTMHIEAQWERIKADSRVYRSSSLASPECLVQAGIMVL